MVRQNQRIIRCDVCDHPHLLATFIADLFKPRRRPEVENLFLRHQPPKASPPTRPAIMRRAIIRPVRPGLTG